MAKLKRTRIPELGRPEITELEVGRKTHKVADVEPLDVDGVRTMTVGTILWGVLVIALVPFWGTLQESGRSWWLLAAVAGLGLGLVGIEYCKRRREALPAKPPKAEPVTEVVSDQAAKSLDRESTAVEVEQPKRSRERAQAKVEPEVTATPGQTKVGGRRRKN